MLGPRVAEFFAGVGLVRSALEQAGCTVVFSNDIDERKRDLYAANFAVTHFMLDDIRNIHGPDVPTIEIATASFPCTDVSLAGNRAGLVEGEESSILAEFFRILDEMGDRRPAGVLLENVTGFATSNGGADLRATIEWLNELGYTCDILKIDAKRFVPQSRPRLFIVGFSPGMVTESEWRPSDLRPDWVFQMARDYPHLILQAPPLPTPPASTTESLSDVLDRFRPDNEIWWDVSRLGGFLASLSDINTERLEAMRRARRMSHATAYRRTRKGNAVWEIRGDDISGCLRTSRGGSSKEAVVEAGRGNVRVRWVTGAEYAKLQGAPDFNPGDSTENQVKFGLGDAVCVPAVRWLAENYLVPVIENSDRLCEHYEYEGEPYGSYCILPRL